MFPINSWAVSLIGSANIHVPRLLYLSKGPVAMAVTELWTGSVVIPIKKKIALETERKTT